VAQRSGLRQDASNWILSVAGGEKVTVRPPGGANPTVCSFRLPYPVDGEAPLLKLLDNWSADHGLQKVRDRAPSSGPVLKRRTSSWDGKVQQGRLAIVFNEEKNLNGGPVLDGSDEAQVLVSLTKAT
jgi:hypothetical protein